MTTGQSNTMTADEWDRVEYFSPFNTTDRWGAPFNMDKGLILALDALRRYINKPIHIHCGYQQRENNSWHNYGLAVDLHIEDMSVVEQFIAASRFLSFTGIGVYPYWHRPGLHLDVRPGNKCYRSYWGCAGPGRYVPLTQYFLTEAIA